MKLNQRLRLLSAIAKKANANAELLKKQQPSAKNVKDLVSVTTRRKPLTNQIAVVTSAKTQESLKTRKIRKKQPLKKLPHLLWMPHQPMMYLPWTVKLQ